MQADEVSIIALQTFFSTDSSFCLMIYVNQFACVLQKKKFDSADYFTEHEKLKKAAGLDGGAKKDGQSGGQGEEHKEEAKK